MKIKLTARSSYRRKSAAYIYRHPAAFPSVYVVRPVSGLVSVRFLNLVFCAFPSLAFSRLELSGILQNYIHLPLRGQHRTS